jgi:hypothetical protein
MVMALILIGWGEWIGLQVFCALTNSVKRTVLRKTLARKINVWKIWLYDSVFQE